MDLLLVFSLTLLVAVLISGLAGRSVLSTAVLFLLVGFAARWFGFMSVATDDPLVGVLTKLALFSVLFTDGMRVGLTELKSAWRLPGRALLFGMPLTLLAIAGLARVVVGLTWRESMLIGAALSPTDPVFAAAIIGRQEVPQRLRHLLNVESGVNDGLALPVVVILLAIAGQEQPHVWRLLGEVAGGIAVGVGLPWLIVKLERGRLLGTNELYAPLLPFAIGLTLYAVMSRLHWNEFLAAFAGGVTLATISPELRDAFHRFGEILAELLKLAALLLFGLLVSVEVLRGTSLSGFAFILLTLLAARPFAIGIALLYSRLSWRERFAAAWFGPKGFASVVYGLLILNSGLRQGETLFHLIAMVVGLSIILHSSSDVAVAGLFHDHQSDEDQSSQADVGKTESERLEELDEPEHAGNAR